MRWPRGIGVLVSGKGTNLQALVDAGLQVAAVAGNVAGAPALERAASIGVPTAVFELRDFPDRDTRDAAIADWLRSHDVGLVVCAGYTQLLRPVFLARFPGRVVNVHPALLPAFPGNRAVEEALAARVTESGATVHLVDEGVDTGAVLRQEAVAVLPDDTAETLHARIKAVEHRLLPDVVRELIGR